jgi:hypothetical protein
MLHFTTAYFFPKVYILGRKNGRCVRLATLPPSYAVVMKSGNLNFLEPSGRLQACKKTNLLLPLPLHLSLPSLLPLPLPLPLHLHLPLTLPLALPLPFSKDL